MISWPKVFLLNVGGTDKSKEANEGMKAHGGVVNDGDNEILSRETLGTFRDLKLDNTTTCPPAVGRD